MQEIVIAPTSRCENTLRELWHYRELFFFLAWRDVLIRYKQTVLGIAWGAIRPLLTMIVLTLVFGKIAKLPSHEAPYAIIVLAGMLPWQFFSSTLSASANSLVGNANLIAKIYFPRIILSSAPLLVNLIDLAISMVVLLVIMMLCGIHPSEKMLALPVLLLPIAFGSLGLGYLAAALNAKYRDFQYLVPFLIQLSLYASPVGYRSDLVPEPWRLIYSINPLVGVIDGFRWSILGGSTDLYVPGLTLSFVLSVLLFGVGVWFFFRAERAFADVI